jgi:hypothetical protein
VTNRQQPSTDFHQNNVLMSRGRLPVAVPPPKQVEVWNRRRGRGRAMHDPEGHGCSAKIVLKQEDGAGCSKIELSRSCVDYGIK